jgi:DNA-binding NtrC family response regulator
VVEDDGDIRRLSTDVLVRCGYHVDAAKDGDGAWNAIQLNCYDLIVTDNDMPMVSGVDLLKKLHAARMAVPTILAAGILPVDEFTRSPWLQPAAMLFKPYTLAELMGTVRQVLRVSDGCCEETARPPSWQDQPAAEHSRRLLRSPGPEDASGGTGKEIL